MRSCAVLTSIRTSHGHSSPLKHTETQVLTEHSNHPPEKSKSIRHRILWILVALFIFLSITAMMMADFYFAPGSSGTTSEPKDAAEK
jgi:hypothetical protein